MTAGAAAFIVNLDVPELESARAFYTAAFGLQAGRRLGDGAIELLGGPCPLYLLEQPPGPSDSGPARDYARHWTPVHLDWVVEDITAAVSRAVAAGARVEHPVRTRRWGRLAVLVDPFGHGFCFIQFVGAGYDVLVERTSA